MDLHAILVKALHGAATGVTPTLLNDLATVYRWAKSDNVSFAAAFNWRVSAKNFLAGVIGGIVGAFGLQVVGISI